MLSLKTGLVSPQFHVKLDSSFKSLKEMESLPPSLWQEKCGFVIPQDTPKSSQETINVAAPQAPAQDSEGAAPQGNDPLAPVEPPDPGKALPDNPNLHLELPPLHQSTRLHCPVDRLTYALACKLTHVLLDVPGNYWHCKHSTCKRESTHLHLQPLLTWTACTTTRPCKSLTRTSLSKACKRS